MGGGRGVDSSAGPARNLEPSLAAHAGWREEAGEVAVLAGT